MKRIAKRMISLIIVSVLTLSHFECTLVSAEEINLTSEQKNAISMLNYITVLTQEINASKNSRVYMEKAYSTLINNSFPNAVDSMTLSQMNGLLDTMENYRMINVKRDRLQYIYEQSQAQAIRAAVPNPMGLIGTVHSFNPAKLIASVVYMAVDSYTSYTSYTAKAEQQYLEDGWSLNDEEDETLHESRKGTFSYMVRMVNDYNLPGDLTLTEDTVSEFVSYKNNNNLVSRIQFLESNQGTYKSYGGYWLTLADSYYNNEDYQKCLDAISEYEKMNTRIFRYDYEFAKVLPLAIAAAAEVYDIDEYAPYAAEHARMIVNNTDHNDWALRYFAAQTFVDLYASTKEKAHLEEAYKIVTDNVNYLVGEQQALNTDYLSEIKAEKIPKDADKEKKRQIEDYNKMLKQLRKTELPPVYEPLLLNCDLLFAVADELNTDDKEKNRIDRMLHPNDEPLFLTSSLDNQYWFGSVEETPSEDMNIVFSGNEMTLPASILTKDAQITVTVEEKGEEIVVLDDWKLNDVDRKEKGNISSFEAIYSSRKASNYLWMPDSSITIDIIPREGAENHITATYKTEGTKDDWYDYFKVWEGHKNKWWEYAKVWENSVRFVRVG